MTRTFWTILGLALFAGIVLTSLSRGIPGWLTAQSLQPSPPPATSPPQPTTQPSLSAAPHVICIETDNKVDPPTSGAGIEITFPANHIPGNALRGLTGVNQSGNGGTITYRYNNIGPLHTAPFTIKNDSASFAVQITIGGHEPGGALMQFFRKHHEIVAPPRLGRCEVDTATVSSVVSGVPWKFIWKTPGTQSVPVGTLSGTAAISP